MEPKINYQKMMEQTISKIQSQDQVPKLLLHSCCAPCSSYVLEYLTNFFYIILLYYNPNIYPFEEYEYRAGEQKRLIEQLPHKHPVDLIVDPYEPQEFHQAAKGFEKEAEGGERCRNCYTLRLERAASRAKEQNCDYFATTLSISPLKDAFKINKIGMELEEKYGVNYLLSDFKKKNGYQRSVELSKQYDLYRQNYCGCVYSRNIIINI